MLVHSTVGQNNEGYILLRMSVSQSPANIFVMRTFLLALTLVLQPTLGCNILGFKYVPPADAKSASSASASTVSVNTRQSCVQCRRSEEDHTSVFSTGFKGRHSPRLFWPSAPSVSATTAATTTTTTTTTAPCCATTELRNSTGTETQQC